MTIFRRFRALLEAIHDLTASVDGLKKVGAEIAAASDQSAFVDRLEELERSRSMWEVNMQALVMKAEGSYHAANNAESRARTMKKHYEKFTDPFDLESTEVPPIPARDASRGEEEGLSPLRLAVAPDSKATALRYKFGVEV